MKTELGVRLSDIGGYEAEKSEAERIVDILVRFELYKSKGALLPKGLLISGKPGTGKTMLAKAIATEAGVPFFEFDTESSEQGDACQAIEKLFADAKAAVPSILFIDEIDKIISWNSIYETFDSDESKTILKTLLTELDGGCTSDGVLVIVTSNRKRNIPPALLRSGRLECQIEMKTPNFNDRAAILKIYLERQNISNIDAHVVAGKTSGFTGADLKALVNDALLNSIREDREPALSDFESWIPVIRLGNIKGVPTKRPKLSVAWHEIGHLLVRYALTGKVSTISTESFGSIEGFIASDENEADEDELNETDAEGILNNVAICLGGMAGEEVFLGKRYCGSVDDIDKAIHSIAVVLSNGVLGFQYLPDMSIPSDWRTAKACRGNKNPLSYQQKVIEILEERHQVAVNLVKKMKFIGEAIYPELIKKGNMCKEELERLIQLTKYREGLWPFPEKVVVSLEGEIKSLES